MNENKYPWIIYTTADKGYPMKIIDGWLTYENGEHISIPNGVLINEGLHRDSGTMIIGEHLRPIPIEMEIFWFSFAENKFFKGTFKLDKEKIEKYFSEAKKMDRKADIKIAPIPGGRVIFYILGPNASVLKMYQGEEYFVKDNELDKELGKIGANINRNEYIKIPDYPQQTKEEIEREIFPYSFWNNLIKKYPWKFRIDYEEVLYLQENKNNFIGFIDGTNYTGKKPETFNSNILKPVPYQINGTFNTQLDGTGMELLYRLYIGNVSEQNYEYLKLDYASLRKKEQELINLFSDFYQKIGNQEFEIVLKIEDNFTPKGLFLKKDNIEQKIPEVYIESYNNTFDKILLEGIPKN